MEQDTLYFWPVNVAGDIITDPEEFNEKNMLVAAYPEEVSAGVARQRQETRDIIIKENTYVEQHLDNMRHQYRQTGLSDDGLRKLLVTEYHDQQARSKHQRGVESYKAAAERTGKAVMEGFKPGDD